MQLQIQKNDFLLKKYDSRPFVFDPHEGNHIVIILPWLLNTFYLCTIEPGNTEHGKCRLTNEYPFFLFLIGHWYYEKIILYL